MALFVHIPPFLLLVNSSWYTFSEVFLRSIQKRVVGAEATEAKTEAEVAVQSYAHSRPQSHSA